MKWIFENPDSVFCPGKHIGRVKIGEKIAIRELDEYFKIKEISKTDSSWTHLQKLNLKMSRLG
jgi:hypothetical protein